MFDRNNPTHLAELKSEVLTDPTNRGYAPDQAEWVLLDQLNNIAQNLTPATGSDYLTPKNLLKVIYPEAVSSQDQFKVQLLYEASQGMGDDISEFRTDIQTLSTAIATAVDTIIRDLSRAEVLWSSVDVNGTQERVNISAHDWRAARDS